MATSALAKEEEVVKGPMKQNAEEKKEINGIVEKTTRDPPTYSRGWKKSPGSSFSALREITDDEDEEDKKVVEVRMCRDGSLVG